ncbi:MAG: CHASE2 domain-containing protein [Verrucomicrobia bacterium]|nr:CHASE2 domain-containing protein [Verrucomicrobiota bacterium]
MAQDARNPLRRGGVIGAALAIGVGLALLFFKFGLGLVHLSYDLPFAVKPIVQPQDVVMVYLDDDSHKELNQPYNAPWDRALHARLLDRLTAEGARAVLFDIVFSDPGPSAEADAELVRAIKANGKVVLAVDCVPAAYGVEGLLAKKFDPPHPMFSEVAADLGSAEVNPDDDLVMRKHVPSSPDDPVAGESWVMAKLIGAEVTKNPANSDRERWRNFYGPAATLPNVSFYRTVMTNITNPLPPGYFSNKVVFVGARLLTKFGGQRKDEFPTPHSRWTKQVSFMPGAEIHAMQFLNLTRGDWLRRLPKWAEVAALVFAGALAGFGLVRFRPVVATGVAVLAALLVSGLAYVSFAHWLVWFPWLLVIAQIFVAHAWSVVFNSVQLYVQNKLFEKSLEMYLSPKLVKKFAANKDLLQPGAKKETLTILFSDIAGFTTISEGMDSDELAKHMNAYFQSAVSDCIHHTDGTIVKYIGDAIFAFWNAPDPQSDHAVRACEAGLRFRDQPAQFMNGQQLITRIGLHTGVANVGNFGSTTRVDYTALGENINLASRMEGLNKYLGTEVLITGDTHKEITGKLLTRFLGDFRLKGFERSVAVHELVGKPDQAETFRAAHEAFAAALQLFREKKLAEAEAAFHRVLELSPKDGPAKFYLKHLAELCDHPLPADWSGEVELKEK